MTGVLTGLPVKDLALVSGDQIIVPTSGCFQPHLVRPSQITPKGFRVFMSNLIEPSQSNANAAVGSFSSSLPYGSRLLQAAVSANCIGGKQMTNAPRTVILASKNPLTGEVQVLKRSVEVLMRNPQAADINPYMMPNDAIACYDSATSNVRDIARALSEIISPFKAHLLD
jgi:polysaccharide export outer membrane protein